MPKLSGLAKAIENVVYSLKPGEDADDKKKYNALNYRHLVKDDGLKTLEIRALRAQRTFQEFLDQANLFVTRIEWLARQKQSPGVNLPEGVSADPNVAPDLQLVQRSLRDYVEVLGLDVDKFRDLAARNRREWEEAALRDKT